MAIVEYPTGRSFPDVRANGCRVEFGVARQGLIGAWAAPIRPMRHQHVGCSMVLFRLCFAGGVGQRVVPVVVAPDNFVDRYPSWY